MTYSPSGKEGHDLPGEKERAAGCTAQSQGEGGWNIPVTSVPDTSWTNPHQASGEVTKLLYKVLGLKAWPRGLTGA